MPESLPFTPGIFCQRLQMLFQSLDEYFWMDGIMMDKQ